MTFPVVTDLAGDGVPVKLSCRVLGFSRQAYYQWLADPVSEREGLGGVGSSGVEGLPAGPCPLLPLDPTRLWEAAWAAGP